MNSNIVYVLKEIKDGEENIKLFCNLDNLIKYYKTLIKRHFESCKFSNYEFKEIEQENSPIIVEKDISHIKLYWFKAELEDYEPKKVSIRNPNNELINIVIEEVCTAFGVRESAVLSESKLEDHRLARFAIISILSDQCITDREIGKTIGRDHSSVTNAKKRTIDELFFNRSFRNKVTIAVNNISIRMDERNLDFKYSLL